VNLEPYVPLLTALFTFANTALLVWSQMRIRRLKEHVNGMRLQALADAEERGRAQALSGGVVAMSVPRGIAPQSTERPLDRSSDDFGNEMGPSTS
jgi:hypothetical protein